MNKSRVWSEQTTQQIYFEHLILTIWCGLFSSGSVGEYLKCNVYGGLASASGWTIVGTSHLYVRILEAAPVALQKTRSEVVNDMRD
jgi:hypothetical protein